MIDSEALHHTETLNPKAGFGAHRICILPSRDAVAGLQGYCGVLLKGWTPQF